jgi:hypothetical protein
MDAVVLVALIGAVATAVAGLGGAAIGFLGPFLQTRTAARTERMKQIVQLAIEDLKMGLEQARYETAKGSKYVAPLVARLQYYNDVLDAIEHNQLDDARLQQIRAKSKAIGEQTQGTT